MLVEFIGAAGTGKSYLTDRVLDALNERGMVARNFDRIEIRKATPRTLALAAKAVYLAAMTRPKTPALLGSAATTITRYSVRRNICAKVHGIHITSEGLFHRIITLQRNGRGVGLVGLADMLFRRIQPPDVVVIVEAGPEKVFARRSDRNRANDQFSIESVRADIAIVEECIVAMTHVQETMCSSLRVIRVSADEDGGQTIVANIVTALEGFARVSGTDAVVRKK